MNKRSAFPQLALIAAAAALNACVTVGGEFNTDRVKTIAIGKTTQTDIEKNFGHPFRTGIDSGDMTWTYVDYYFSLFGGDRATDLLVKFNADGTVKSYAFNTNQTSQPESR